MTPQDLSRLLSLPAGPELDASACKAVGIPIKDERYVYEGMPRSFPPVSTDIAAAFVLVEKMQKRGRQLTLDYRFFVASWSANFTSEDGFAPNTKTICCAETAPLAIVRAALRALGGEK